jgi:hypothetical protein
VIPEVANSDGDEITRRTGEEHLTAVAGCGDSGSAMDVRACIPQLSELRLPRVQAYPNPNRCLPQRSLRVSRRGDRIGRARERNEERIALRVDLHPTVPRPDRAQLTVVLSEKVGVLSIADFLQEPCRSLDVRKEERDGAGREIRSHARSLARSTPGGKAR